MERRCLPVMDTNRSQDYAASDSQLVQSDLRDVTLHIASGWIDNELVACSQPRSILNGELVWRWGARQTCDILAPWVESQRRWGRRWCAARRPRNAAAVSAATAVAG